MLEFTDCDPVYPELVTNTVIPDKYICGRNFQAVKEHLKQHTRVLITGPKGIGKSVCLVANWQVFTKENKDVILLGIDTIRQFKLYPVRKYLLSLQFSEKSFKNM